MFTIYGPTQHKKTHTHAKNYLHCRKFHKFSNHEYNKYNQTSGTDLFFRAHTVVTGLKFSNIPEKKRKHNKITIIHKFHKDLHIQ